MWLKDITPEHFDKAFDTNVRFPMFLMKERLPYLRRGGRVVSLGSVVRRQGWKMHPAYGIKARRESLARSWAVELGHNYGITVNAVNPGPVATDMPTPAEALVEFDHYIKSTPAAPRVGTVDDIAQTRYGLPVRRWCQMGDPGLLRVRTEARFWYDLLPVAASLDGSARI
ncbi:hypothetical protein A1O3_06106 [Capronia epimyces CBS 606.96]|uniref:3-oxoacyl-[acyl-carrier protein] reductase n=1 Tax=Capronia epimyces CBS 606.96 TaxID=1182542 RepID=W9XPY8_9EURO|nr:uncharacterized protein A1O3_06106 [Capronia epimyces CBS 606.96]EXJ82293.1 hypothetical protein A1O3_06106 [Capronia epimyces CBS 606.96]